jgi:hypothetical protein
VLFLGMQICTTGHVGSSARELPCGAHEGVESFFESKYSKGGSCCGILLI